MGCHNLSDQIHQDSDSLWLKSKFSLLKLTKKLSKKIVGCEIREIISVMYSLVANNFDFPKKSVQKNLSEKLVKLLRFCTFSFLTILISRKNCLK